MADTRIASWSSDGRLSQQRSLEAHYSPPVLSSLALRVRAGVTVVLSVVFKHPLEGVSEHEASRVPLSNYKSQILDPAKSSYFENEGDRW